MFDINKTRPDGVLRAGWSAAVDDYALVGGWSAQGQVFAVGDVSGGLKGLEGTSGKTLWSHTQTHEGGMLAAEVSPSRHQIVTSGQDGRLVVWNLSDGKRDCELPFSQDWVEHVAWSPDGQLIAAASRRTVRVWTKEGEAVWTSPEFESTVSAISWSSAKELVTACYGAVRFFTFPSGKEKDSFVWKGSLVSLALSPDGDIVACGSQDNSVHFWRRSTGEDSMMSGYPSKPGVLAFNEAGTLLATGGGKNVTIWCFAGLGPEGTRPGVLALHVRLITSLQFSHQGTRLASGGKDGAVVVWHVKSDGEGESMGAAMSSAPIGNVFWRPDDRGLVALDANGGVTAYRVR